MRWRLGQVMPSLLTSHRPQAELTLQHPPPASSWHSLLRLMPLQTRRAPSSEGMQGCQCAAKESTAAQRHSPVMNGCRLLPWRCLLLPQPILIYIIVPAEPEPAQTEP